MLQYSCTFRQYLISDFFMLEYGDIFNKLLQMHTRNFTANYPKTTF